MTRVAKRALDVVVATVLLVLSAPLLAAATLAVKATSPGGAIYRQTRIGLAEAPFTILKLRTMTANNDDSDHRAFCEALLKGDEEAAADGVYKLLDDPRVTPVGGLLRRFSLDELPQLWNVVRGDMSLVGPRPSMPWEVELFSDRHRARALVRPGCTGLWQVSGRNRLTTLQMLDLDLEYVARCGFWRNLWILVRTPIAMVRGDGAR